MQNSNLIVIRSMPDSSVSEYIVTRVNPWENKAPNAVHTVGPSLDIKKGIFNIDFQWLDYELLGIKLYKDDNPQLVAYRTNLNNYKQKKILDVQTQLGDTGLEKIKMESEIQKIELALSKLDKEIEGVDVKLNEEKVKEVRDDKKLNSLLDTSKKQQDKKTGYVEELKIYLLIT